MRRDVDEYQLEISSVRQALNRLKAEPNPDLQLLDEYEAELRNLMALYEAASDAFAAGERDPAVRRALEELGFGDWSFEAVYAFVYDAAMDAELDGRDLAGMVRHTDYAASLLAALDAGSTTETG